MLLSLLQRRRSIRQFEPHHVEIEKVQLLAEALLRAPSSRGRNPWEFVIVDDPGKLKALSNAKAHGSAFLDGAPLAVVLCGDPDRSDVWIEDCAIATIILQLTAESLGLGSCWAQMRLRLNRDGRTAEDYLRPIIGLPEQFRVLAIVGIGYPAESKNGHARESLEWGKLHRNQFGAGWPENTVQK